MTLIRSYNIYEDKGNTEGDKAMSHPWRSRGTIVRRYEPQRKYLTDMQNAIRHALEVAYELAIRDHNRIPSPIALMSSRGSCQTTIMQFTTSTQFPPLPDNIRKTIMAS
ncbi:MAG: hypothetical protein QXO68_01915 [Conexivisphaerales archaeon]